MITACDTAPYFGRPLASYMGHARFPENTKTSGKFSAFPVSENRARRRKELSAPYPIVSEKKAGRNLSATTGTENVCVRFAA